MISFQFHSGTIRSTYTVEGQEATVNFNSTQVRLEVNSAAAAAAPVPYFNSTQVRLEAAVGRPPDHQQLRHFNSTQVRLEVFTHKQPKQRPQHFNSTQVRLEVLAVAARLIPSAFQFHSGTIRRYPAWFVPPVFRSISIPLRYD